MCIQLGNIRQPLIPAEAMCVFNDLIKDTPTQESLTEFKLARRTKKAREQDTNQCEDMDMDISAYGSVGIAWYHAFMKIHAGGTVLSNQDKKKKMMKWTKSIRECASAGLEEEGLTTDPDNSDKNSTEVKQLKNSSPVNLGKSHYV